MIIFFVVINCLFWSVWLFNDIIIDIGFCCGNNLISVLFFGLLNWCVMILVFCFILIVFGVLSCNLFDELWGSWKFNVCLVVVIFMVVESVSFRWWILIEFISKRVLLFLLCISGVFLLLSFVFSNWIFCMGKWSLWILGCKILILILFWNCVLLCMIFFEYLLDVMVYDCGVSCVGVILVVCFKILYFFCVINICLVCFFKRRWRLL